MKRLKLFVFMFLVIAISSCVKNEGLKDDARNANSVTATFNAFIVATRGSTPDNLKKDEYVYFQTVARAYTGDYSTVGIETHQVIKVDPNGQYVRTDGSTLQADDVAIVDTIYNVPTDGSNPTIKTQTEADSQYIPAPYMIWSKGGSLPPYQNYWLYSGFEDGGQKIFYNLKTYSQKEKLPQRLIDENRCYGFANCEVTMNYVEFDAYQKDDDGTEQRVHLTNSFSGELPYMASNPKQCLDTLVKIPDNQGGTRQVPYQVCRILVDFKPGP